MSSFYKVTPPWRLYEAYGDGIDVEVADLVDTRSGRTYIDGAFRVLADGKPCKRGKGGTVPFKGEFAWADAERLANDLVFQRRWARS